MAKIIGLTGGIGSGKSTVARYIASKGISVYIADEEAKKIMYRDDVIQEIITTFGNKILDETHKIDRKQLAAVVFKDKEKLNQLNNIIHPKVKQHFKDWLLAHKDEKFIIKEVAILFETNGHLDCDKVILVTSPKKIRLQRVIERDNTTKEAVLDRMNHQMPEKDKKKLADYIIYNVDLEKTYQQVDELLIKLINS